MNQIVLSVPEVHCDHCKTSIEGAVGALDGVASVDVSIDERVVRITAGPGTDDAIVAAIEEQGYEVTGRV